MAISPFTRTPRVPSPTHRIVERSTVRSDRAPLRTARCLLTDGARHLLVVHAGGGRHRHPRWGLPGGHIDRGEAADAAVHRELDEELEIAVAALRFQADYRYKGTWHRIFTAHFAGAIGWYDEQELLDIGWFTLDEVVELAERDLLHAGYELDVVRTEVEHLPRAESLRA